MSSEYVKINNNVEEGIEYPWTVHYHKVKKRKFYFNVITKISTWEHPSGRKSEEYKMGTEEKFMRRTEETTKHEEKKRRPEDRTKEEKRKAGEDSKRTEERSKDEKRKMGEYSRRTEESPNDDRKRKRLVKTFEDEIKKTRTYNVQPDNNKIKQCEEEAAISTYFKKKYITPAEQMSANVEWSKQARRRSYGPYRGCAILDTNVLLNMPNIVMETTKKQILTVIPYTVLMELDGLKRDRGGVGRDAQEACKKLLEAHERFSQYVELESSVEHEIKLPMFRIIRGSNDEFIVNCGLRIKEELLSMRDKMNLSEESIVFVTNDINLKLKAQAHTLRTVGLKEFSKTIGFAIPPHRMYIESNNGYRSENYRNNKNSNNFKPSNGFRKFTAKFKEHVTTTLKEPMERDVEEAIEKGDDVEMMEVDITPREPPPHLIHRERIELEEMEDGRECLEPEFLQMLVPAKLQRNNVQIAFNKPKRPPVPYDK